jgi:hypothetical protein
VKAPVEAPPGAASGRTVFDEYSRDVDGKPPLKSYAAATAIFATGLTALLVASRRGSVRLPPDPRSRDLIITGIASHKLSRLIAKDKVTSFLRAPFRRLEGEAGPAELDEQTRGDGVQAAVGEMIGCPYCLGLWVATAFGAGLAVAPTETRFVAGTLTALTIADFLQIAYKVAEDQL